MQRVSDPPPLRHAVISILKKTKLAGFPTFEGLPEAHAPIPSARWKQPLEPAVMAKGLTRSTTCSKVQLGCFSKIEISDA